MCLLQGDVGDPGNDGRNGTRGDKGEKGINGRAGPPGPTVSHTTLNFIATTSSCCLYLLVSRVQQDLQELRVTWEIKAFVAEWVNPEIQ